MLYFKLKPNFRPQLWPLMWKQSFWSWLERPTSRKAHRLWNDIAKAKVRGSREGESRVRVIFAAEKQGDTCMSVQITYFHANTWRLRNATSSWNSGRLKRGFYFDYIYSKNWLTQLGGCATFLTCWAAGNTQMHR